MSPPLSSNVATNNEKLWVSVKSNDFTEAKSFNASNGKEDNVNLEDSVSLYETEPNSNFF